MSVPVGEAMVGRVVNALGQPIDGKGPIATTEFEPHRAHRARASSTASPVKEPLQTGIKAIDAMVPIGRGQRELIIGDRQTGKTAVALDTIINQKGKGVICIYVAIGQKNSTVAQVVRTLEQTRGHGAHHRGVGLRLRARAPPLHRPLRGLRHRRVLPRQQASTPSASTTTSPSRPRPIARSRCSCAARPAARRIPGDVFYLHSRLLERAAKLNDEERRRQPHRAAHHRDPGRRHLGLHPDERHLDHRRPDLPRGRPLQLRHPARHQRRQLGLAASAGRRAGQGHEGGGRPPAPRPRAVPRARRLRACSPPTSTSRPRPSSTRGQRLTEILKQDQYSPLPGREADRHHLRRPPTGFLDALPVADCRTLRSRALLVPRDRHAALLDEIAEKKDLKGDLGRALKAALQEFAVALPAQGRPLGRRDKKAPMPTLIDIRRRIRASRTRSRSPRP